MDTGKDERSVFRRAMLGVRPLKNQNRVVPKAQRPPARARHARAARAAVLHDSLRGELIEQPGGEIEFRRGGVTPHTLRRLARGDYSVGAEVDLHGMTRLEARDALKAFVDESTRLRLGCVRVIHGKGRSSGPAGPVLKHAVQEWLAQWDDVIAFASADRRHGGTGALYVLLRTR